MILVYAKALSHELCRSIRRGLLVLASPLLRAILIWRIRRLYRVWRIKHGPVS